MIVHLNGKLVPADQARISPFDRGFVFGDGVYEGLRSVPCSAHPGRRIVGIAGHIQRMRFGLDLAHIRWSPSELHRMSLDLVAANDLTDAFVYWQVTRGTPGPKDPVRTRNPAPGMTPTVFGYCTPQPPLASFSVPPVKSVITCEDKRWLMGRLKSISLMGNILGALQVQEAGVDEAIFLRDGLVAEGLATNVMLALPSRTGGEVELVTPALESVPILAGVTRDILLRICPELKERAVRADELERASEVMLIGTTTMVTSVINVDGRVIGDGTPGPQAKRLVQMLVSAIQQGKDGPAESSNVPSTSARV